jgi:4-amino-4-deoxy-L-arabinose transferase-like glycosyltransferase
MTHRRLLYLILALYTALGLLYLVATPPFEASDELSHYPMVNYLARSGLQLPPLDPAAPGAWRQEGAQPPLYYLLAAVLTSGIDTADMHAVRRLNPHADIGTVSPDGNVNMIVQRPDALAFPWRGTVLAVYITRLFSLTLGAATVITTYAIARAVFPGKPLLAPAAAALNAFLPMFLFIAASVNNDNLSTLLGGLLTLLIVHLLKTSTLPRLRLYVVIGLAAGASLLAKLNLGFLIPFVALAR